LGAAGGAVSAVAAWALSLGGITWKWWVVGRKQRLGSERRMVVGSKRVTWQQMATGFRIWDDAGR